MLGEVQLWDVAAVHGHLRNMTRPPASAAYLIHRPRRRNELHCVDLVADPLRLHVGIDSRGEFLVRGTAANQCSHVHLVDGEQTIPQLPIGRNTKAVAVEAEWFADGSDEA